MNKKKRFLMSLCCALVVSASAGFAACDDSDKKKPQSGNNGVVDEVFEGTGEYYATASDGTEYNLSLANGVAVMTLGGSSLNGTYTYSKGTLTIKFTDGTTATATLSEDVLTVVYNDGSYRFIEKVSYTVSYSVDGQIASTVNVLNGKKVSKPTDPSKEGCVFAGWYTDAEFKTKYAFDATVVGSDFTLYARFVEVKPEAQEFDVKFVVDGNVVATVKTVGGVVYALPEDPEKEGAVFAGWWLSSLNDATKPTTKYEEQVLTENTTLYAVWETADTNAIVSVSQTGVSITASGVNNSFKVKITNEAGEVLNGAAGQDGETTSKSEYPFDFSKHPAGKYTIDVTFNGKTTTVYYLNKVLSKVSNFSVVEESGTRILNFNAVQGATKYLITVDCGNDDHNHTDKEITATNYDFTGCDMQKGGIKFTVKAVADGYLTSESEVYTFERNLDAVSGLAYDEQTDKFTWSAVANAQTYVVEVNGQEYEPTANTYFSVQDYDAGDLTIKVYPVAKGYNSSEAVSLTYKKTRLKTPTGLKLEGTKVIWNTVNGATGYVVKIGNNTYNTSNTEFQLEADHYNVENQITVSAVAASGSSFESAPLTVSLKMATPTYTNGVVSWNPVVGADAYGVQVNGGTVQSVDKNATSASVTLTKEGLNTISVCFYNGSTPSEWVEVEVTAYALTFDVKGGYAVDPIYKAKGDNYELPSATNTGYNFGGWYNTPGGADDNGQQLGNGKYETEGNTVFYAYWIPKEYEITFVVDDGSITGTVEEETVFVKFGQHYTLPKAVSDDVAYTFGGWYAGKGAQGLKYTNSAGESDKVWNFTENQTFYVGWLKLLEFTELENGGYSVSRSDEGINEVTVVKIPESYKEIPVVEIAANAFDGCSKLEEVIIPDTIQTINISGVDGPYSTGSAFKGCTKLTKITVYCTDEANHGVGDHQQKYYQVDGMLVKDDETMGMVLEFIPLAHESTKTGVLNIPDVVETLPINVFSGAKYTQINVPASVTKINAYAFGKGSSNVDELTTVNFLEAEEGEEKPLVIEANAFDGRAKLTAIALPARVQSFDAFSVFSGCKKLGSIEIVGVSANQVYTSKAGMLCDAIGETLIYCPAANKGDEGVMTIPTGVTKIAANAFENNTGITELVLSGQVTEIGAKAFAGCSSLKKITFVDTDIARGLTIKQEAFYGTGLTSLDLVNHVQTIEKYAFGNTKSLKEVSVNTTAETLNFANNAFATPAGDTYVKKLSLGKDVKTLYINGVFGGNIETVTVDDASTYYDALDGVLFNEGMKEIVYFPSAKQVGENGYEIPASVEVIGASVFKNKKNLTKVVIGAKVRLIAEEAFANAINLEAVEFKPSEDALTVEEKAFAGCSSLTENTFALPARTRTIGNNAFQNATGFNSFVIPEGVTTLGDYVFSGASSLVSVSLPATLIQMGTYKDDELTNMQVFAACEKLANITVAGGNEYFSDVDGILYVKAEGEEKELLIAPLQNTGKTVQEDDGSTSYVVNVPATVVKVWNGAFNRNETYTKILFADAVANEASLEIGKQAFEGSAVKEVKLPEGLAAIADAMFKGCLSLETINIPKSVTTVGVEAFYGCKSLKTLNFAQDRTSNLTFADATATTSPFYGCSSLTSITLPEKTTTIGTHVFYNLVNLGEVSLPSTLTKIGDNAFYKTGIKSITIPASVTTLGKNAFQFSDALSSVTINSTGLKTIDNYAFADCENLTSVDLTKATALTTIGTNAFQYAAITSITLPDSLTKIGAYAFANTSIKSISIPKKVATLEKYAFQNCEDLATATFVACTDTASIATTLTLGEGNFYGCSSLKTLEIPKNVATIPKWFVRFCTSLGTITFSSGSKLATVSANAFDSCSITSIAFPATTASKLTLNKEIFSNCKLLAEVTLCGKESITIGAFDKCYSLTTIKVREGGGVQYNTDGYLLDSTGTTVLMATSMIKPENGVLRLPDTVNFINSNAFKGQLFITEVVLPYNLQNIGTYAFQDCTSLEKITFAKNAETGDDCLLQEIGNYAFDGCTALKTVALPHGVTTLGNYVFQDCSSLVNLTLNDNLTTVGTNVFQNCTKLTTVKVPASLTSIGNYMFKGCTALSSVTLSDGLALIGGYMFDGCTSLTAITLPNDVSFIGNYAFQNTALKSIVIPANVKQLGGTSATASVTATTLAGQFNGCTELGSVTFNGAIEYIGKLTFSGCTSLTTIKFPETAKSTITIGEGESATTLQASLPNSLTLIGDNAFDKTAFSEMILPTSVTTLGASVFSSCPNIETVYVPAVTTMGASLFENNVKLTKIYLADGITYGKVASNKFTHTSATFKGCTALESVHVSAYATNAGFPTSMFNGCTALKTVTFDDSITTFNSYMFQNCTALTGVDEEGKETLKLPTSLKYLGQESFMGSGIQKITIPANVTQLTSAEVTSFNKTMVSSIFMDCVDLEKVTLLGEIDAIGQNTFKNCGELTSIVDKDGKEYAFSSLKWIGSNAFEDSGIQKMNLSNVQNLGCYVFTGTKLKEADLSGVTTSFSSTYEFAGCLYLEKVTLSKNVTTLAGHMFEGCTALKQITLPDSLTTLAEKVFSDSGLESITLPANLKKVSTAFAGTNLKSIHIPALVPYGSSGLDEGDFEGCEQLTNITIDPNNKDFIVDDGMLYNVKYTDTAKTQVDYYQLIFAPVGKTYANGTLTLKDNSYVYSSSAVKGLSDKITKVVFGKAPSAKSTIPSSMFSGWEKLTEVVIPDGYTQINNYVFQNCVNLSKIEIPSSIIYIGDSSFLGCKSLTAITLPNGLKYLGSQAFKESGLTSVHIPVASSNFSAPNGSLNMSVFDSCVNLRTVTIGEGVKEIGTNAFSNCSSLMTITLPESLEKIGGKAFEGTAALTELVIPANVNTLADTALGQSSGKECGLEKIIFKGIPSTFGTKSSGTGNSLFLNLKNLKEVVFPSGWTTFTKQMFQGSGITSITLPTTLTTYGIEVFKDCTNLIEVIIPEGITSLGESMFSGCTALTSLELPSTLTSIANSAFTKSGLTSLEIPDNVSLGTGLFLDCKELTSVTLPDGIMEIPATLFSGCVALETYTIPASVQAIGKEAFKGSSLATIEIPDKVRTIGQAAFENCAKLTSVKLPSKLQILELNTFKDCTNLTSIELPESLLEFGNGVFQNSGLTSFTLPSKVVALSDNLFADCKNLTTVVLHENLITLGSAFKNTTALKSIVIPASVCEGKSKVFAGWTEEQTVYFEASRNVVNGYHDELLIDCNAEIVYDYVAESEE